MPYSEHNRSAFGQIRRLALRGDYLQILINLFPSAVRWRLKDCRNTDWRSLNRLTALDQGERSGWRRW